MKMRTLFAVGVAAVTATLLWALPAQAAETIYWSNYSTSTLAFANIDGSGGGQFDTAGQEVVGSEGLAIDSASGRLYWTNFSNGSDTGAIRYAGLGGGDGGQLNAGGATVAEPAGLAIDPKTETIYWTNYEGGAGNNGTISYAKLDGSAAGDLNTAGATVEAPEAIAIDQADGRVYWSNSDDTISYAKLDNSGGGGNLDLSGATPPNGITGLSINPAAGQIYWVSNSAEKVSYASLNGGGGDIDYGSASFDDPFGLAFDPTNGRIYWGNYDHGNVPPQAIGFANLGGGGGGITIATAPVEGPQNPIVFKGPSGTGAPTASRTPNTTNLSCSQGSWAEDYAGSFVYQAPRSYSYQWLVNGTSIGGANASTYTATAPGSYSCSVTGTNQNGSATQTSNSVSLAAASLAVSLRKRKVRTKAGHKATFVLMATDAGDFPLGGARVCVKTTKKARKALKTPKCRSLGTIAAATTSVLKLKLRARGVAKGAYKLRFAVKGYSGIKPLKATLVVKPKKKHHRKHRKR